MHSSAFVVTATNRNLYRPVNGLSDVRQLVEMIFDPGRHFPVALMVSRRGERTPPLNPHKVREILPDCTEMFFVHDGILTQTFARSNLGDLFVTDGSIRVWRPGVGTTARETVGPFVLIEHGRRREARALENLRAALAGSSPVAAGHRTRRLLTGHAIERYRTRVDSSATVEQIQELLNHGVFSRKSPALLYRGDAEGVIVAGKAVFLVARQGDVLVTVTCLHGRHRRKSDREETWDGVQSDDLPSTPRHSPRQRRAWRAYRRAERDLWPLGA